MKLSDVEKQSIEDEISSGKKLISIKWLIWLYNKIEDEDESI